MNEDEVPDFDAEIRIHIHELSAGVAIWCHVDMEFRTGATRSGISHFPKVVFDVAIDDMDLWIESGFFEETSPDLVGFMIEFRGITFAGSVDGRVKSVGRKSPAFDDKFPSPGDGVFLEVVAEGPVPQHFKKGMVIGVVADILKVVVFPAGADAFLGIGGAWRIVWSFLSAKEVWNKLIHSRICKKESWRLWQNRGGGDSGVLFLLKEVEEAIANLCRSHDGGFRTTF